MSSDECALLMIIKQIRVKIKQWMLNFDLRQNTVWFWAYRRQPEQNFQQAHWTTNMTQVNFERSACSCTYVRWQLIFFFLVLNIFCFIICLHELSSSCVCVCVCICVCVSVCVCALVCLWILVSVCVDEMEKKKKKEKIHTWNQPWTSAFVVSDVSVSLVKM